MWTRLKQLGALSITLPMLSCVTLTTGTDASCRAFQIITFSGQHDTPETVAQVREHNAAWRAVCPEKKE